MGEILYFPMVITTCLHDWWKFYLRVHPEGNAEEENNAYVVFK
jgi:hypothetical protein